MALLQEFDVIFACNILNIQADINAMREIIEQCLCVTKKGGRFISNYPLTPRQLDLSTSEVERILFEYFPTVIRHTVGNVSLFDCKK